jgi:hypothetical protein
VKWLIELESNVSVQIKVVWIVVYVNLVEIELFNNASDIMTLP